MPDWNQVSGAHVRAALDEYDKVGAKDFLARYGFRRARLYTLWHHGNEYDAHAVLGAAYLKATGRAATADDLAGGEEEAADVLKGLGFDVVAQEQPVVTPRTRSAAPARKRVTRAEPVVTICPRCQMALPATGVCDFCD